MLEIGQVHPGLLALHHEIVMQRLREGKNPLKSAGLCSPGNGAIGN
jgi:hypothetical protein